MFYSLGFIHNLSLLNAGCGSAESMVMIMMMMMMISQRRRR
jgi:hypothetical protein